ncbi:MAG: hypothetical protein ABW042_05630 [Phenylobacterium sp.]
MTRPPAPRPSYVEQLAAWDARRRAADAVILRGMVQPSIWTTGDPLRART